LLPREVKSVLESGGFMQFAVDGFGQPNPARKGSLSMAKNIYVGNLTWECTADDLLALF